MMTPKTKHILWLEDFIEREKAYQTTDAGVQPALVDGVTQLISEYGAYCRLYGLTPELSAEMKAERIYPIDG